MREYAYDEFGHLLVLQSAPPALVGILPDKWWGHVHEDQALGCAWLEDNGWPRGPAL
jgi:hypothetical protein